jgi:phage/plasmid primase-like uncharacterized protein
MLRKVGVLVGLLVFAGGLWAADPQEKKASKKKSAKAVTAKVVSVDAANGMLTVKSKEGTEKELAVGEQTKFMDAQGNEVSEGIKDKRLAAGTDVRLMLDEDGKTVKELHFVAKAKTAQASGRPSKVFPVPPKGTVVAQEPPKHTGPQIPLPPVGTVVKVNKAKKEIVVQMVGSKAKGKGEEKTVEVTDGVKLLGAEGDDADVGGFRPGDAVILLEKDGKVTQLQIFKLGAGEKKRKVKK